MNSSISQHILNYIDRTMTWLNQENDVVMTWPDNHKSKYSLDWLKRRSFEEEDNKKKFLQFYSRKPKIWGRELQDQIPCMQYDELMTNDHELYKWIVTLEETGITLVTGAPRKVGVLKKIGERVAFLVKTNYGENFTVKSKERPNNLAYCSKELGLHTDLAYYHYTPGVQMLHCISQVETDGGENQFTDGFYAAKLMKQDYPELYRFLTNTKIDYFNVGADAYTYHKVSMLPIIQENSEGEVVKITYSNPVRGYHTTLTVKEVQLFYEAMTTFEKIVNSERCQIKYKLNNGDIACFHNYRILHGRKGYTVTGEGERHLDGGYINWDELKSRRRVLQNQLKLD